MFLAPESGEIPRQFPRLPVRRARLSVRFVEEPSLKTSRLAIAGFIAAALVLGGAGFLLGRSLGPASESTTDAASETILPIPTPTWAGPLARADLIALGALAADAAAAGLLPDVQLQQNQGRRFEIRLPFGCTGPAAEDDTAGWTYDEGSSTLRVFVTPQQWSAEDWLSPDAGDGSIEAIEGFWIERPWTSSESCPPSGATAPATPAIDDDAPPPDPDGEAQDQVEPPPAPAAAPPTLAIGQIYTAEGSRSGRRNGEPFRAVVRLAADQLDTSQGFRLRITGRLTSAADRIPAICRQTTPVQPPACLITAAIDEISIENPVSGSSLATWTLAQRSTRGSASD